MIQYIAMLKWKPETPRDQLDALFAALPGIMAKSGLEWSAHETARAPGTNADWCFMAKFESLDGVADWTSPNPVHAEVIGLMRPMIGSASIISFPI